MRNRAENFTAVLKQQVRWYAYVLWYEARELWRAMPGPWYVKLLLIAVCSLIPGPGDEIGIILLTAYMRRRRNRKLRSS